MRIEEVHVYVLQALGSDMDGRGDKLVLGYNPVKLRESVDALLFGNGRVNTGVF